MELPYPYFIELIEYYSDPESFVNGIESDEELHVAKQRMENNLKRLRNED